MKTVYIGLGSNLNQPHAQLQQAIQALANLEKSQFVKLSSFYESEPWGPIQNQPKFINAVAELATEWQPLELWPQLRAIELAQGRLNTAERYGPRPIDLDILLYDQIEWVSEELIIPHPQLGERDFVIYPLLELAPDLILPNGISLSAIARQCVNRLKLCKECV